MSGRQYGERRLEFRILGPTELLVDGVPVPLTAPKLRTVLVALLLSRGRLVSDVSLSELLWGPLPPATMAAQLYTYISRLRRSCEPGLDVRRGLRGYRLDIGTAGFDLHHFQRAADRGRQSLRDGQYAMAAGQLASALSLWRGPALADVTESLTAAELPCLEESHVRPGGPHRGRPGGGPPCPRPDRTGGTGRRAPRTGVAAGPVDDGSVPRRPHWPTHCACTNRGVAF